MADLKETEEEFYVACIRCQHVWAPSARSPLWWRAKKHAGRGYLDALHVTGEECGCVNVEEKREPDAPYRVLGFDDMGVEFDIPFTSFADAVKAFRNALRGHCTVFIQGVSPAVEARLTSL